MVFIDGRIFCSFAIRIYCIVGQPVLRCRDAACRVRTARAPKFIAIRRYSIIAIRVRTQQAASLHLNDIRTK